MKTSLSVWFPLAIFAVAAEAKYQTFQSRFDGNNSVRIKEHQDGELCNGGSKHYTGWVDIGDEHLFFWYHPQRHGKPDAPLAIWLQGGPGGTSMAGAFIENGPCLFSNETNSTYYNPHSWTEEFHMLYLDQPVPVGFSYAGGNLTDDLLPGRAEKSAIDFLTAVLLIYEAFSGVYFAALTPLHLSGESYAGRYLPVYADAIVDYNSRVAPSDRIPLRSVMVGNGYTSPKHLFPSFYETACFEVHGIPAILNETQCAHIEAAVDRCELLLEACVSSGDEIICHAGGEFCQEAIMDPITQSGSNAYDRTMKCPEGSCYPHFKNVIDWFNSAEVQEALEIVDQTGRAANVSLQKESVTDRFKASGDIWMSSMPYMERVLQSDQVDVLYYTGINDIVCNSIGVLRTVMDLKWRGHAKFVATPMVPVSWTLQDGSNGGRMKQNGRLTAAELYGGGHVYPMDQPAASLKMVQAWLSEIDFQTKTIASARRFGKPRSQKTISIVATPQEL